MSVRGSSDLFGQVGVEERDSRSQWLFSTFEGRVVAAVLSVAWHKTPCGLVYPTPGKKKVKLWVGLLELSLCDQIEFDAGEAPRTFLGTVKGASPSFRRGPRPGVF